MKVKKIILGSVIILLSTALIACTPSSSTETETSSLISVDHEDANVTYFTEVDLTDTYDVSTASSVKLSKSTASASGEGVSVDGSGVTISTGALISFQGRATMFSS